MINIGDKVKLIDLNGKKEKREIEHIGFVESISNSFIVIRLKNYRTCINRADLIENTGLRLQVRKNREWLEVGKGIFESVEKGDNNV